MRRNMFYSFTLVALLTAAGCATDLLPSSDGVISAVGSLDGSTASASDSSAGITSATISGSVSGTGDYQLFDVGPSSFGDDWVVSMIGSNSSASAFTLVLLDEDYDLLMRARVSTRSSLRHILRADTSTVYVGVMPYYNSSGGNFGFTVSRDPGASVPAACRQVVYLDFREGDSVSVHRRSAISYPAFDGALLGNVYADHTQLIKDTIVAAVREDYAAYDLLVVSSDDGPPPTGVEYSTVYFGGADSALLGLADSVDMYNEEHEQVAMVYVESFGQYSVMGLTAEDMGVMIGNVGSHELGHLLGLYHTKDPDEVMDSTGSAWDLAGEQTFHRGPLEDSVFPTGTENTPRLLEQTLGLSDKPATSKTLDVAKALRHKELRRFMDMEIHHRCGLCINPDE